MGYLVAEQTTATAVTEDLSTLIDWVHVEQFSAFRVTVENVGGGLADRITDVQIDESDDGGATSDLDQHAGVPTVAITPPYSSTATFTSTAKWLRVRALCAAGETTTAKAYLMADTMTGLLCTLADIRIRLGLETGDTDDDQMLYSIIKGVSAAFDTYCNRTFILNSSAATEYYSGGRQKLYLPRYPILSITSVTESVDWDWDNETALTADDDYHAMTDRGALHRVGTLWLSGAETVRVVYTGGYVAAGGTAGTGETALPDDIQEAALLQSMFTYKRRDDLGLAGVSAMGGSISKFSAIELLPEVKAILNKYRRSPHR